MIAHTAITLRRRKIKNIPAVITLIDDRDSFTGGLYFSITDVATYDKFAVIDLSYYYKTEPNKSVRDCYRGQAMLIFKNNGVQDWQLIQIVNTNPH